MAENKNYLNHPDPEYVRLGMTYRSFPGVEQCVRLILERKAKGAWADIVFFELAKNAADCFDEIVDAIKENSSNDVRLFMLMALEEAALPESVEILKEVLHSSDPRCLPYAKRALAAIDTNESRKVLFEAGFRKGKE